MTGFEAAIVTTAGVVLGATILVVAVAKALVGRSGVGER